MDKNTNKKEELAENKKVEIIKEASRCAGEIMAIAYSICGLKKGVKSIIIDQDGNKFLLSYTKVEFSDEKEAKKITFIDKNQISARFDIEILKNKLEVK